MNEKKRSAQQFFHLAFDLDDTLMDTSRQLIPRASRDSCLAMIAAGLNTNIEQCLQAWEKHGREHLRRDLFTHLVDYFGVRDDADPQGVAHRGYHAFYNRKVESDISLFPGVREMLVSLHANYSLHLVTSGSRNTQEEKIKILGLHEMFETIHHIDPNRGEHKRSAFADIAARTGGAPSSHLSIGNRVDTDIAEARMLGWRACWVRYGEYASMHPGTPDEIPEFEIDSITELVGACQL